MNSQEMKIRTKTFGLNIIKLIEGLQKCKTTDIIGRQLIRSAVSVGANYRALCRAKSKQDFIFKLKVVEEEVDESSYWLEVLVESGMIKKDNVDNLLQEANELTSIVAASIKTAKKNN